MLQITPQALHLIRSVQETHLAREREKRRQKSTAGRKLARDYRRRLIDGAAVILRKGDPTPFAFEAFVRNGLRAGLCLRGWKWADADGAAAEVVSAALRQIGAVRPTWQQGQPEWTQDGVVLWQRTRCIRCGWKLPPENRKFCGPVCFAAHHNALARRYRADEIAALEAFADAA